MSRPLRLEFANALYHVTSRGDRREPIFIDEADRSMWLDVFGQVCGRFNWRCHAQEAGVRSCIATPLGWYSAHVTPSVRSCLLPPTARRLRAR